MLTKVFKYFSLLFFLNCLLLAQENVSEDGQLIPNTEILPGTAPEIKSLQEIYQPSADEVKKLNEFVNRSVIKQNYETAPQNKKEETVFNILSASYRNNIRFGGFWDKYAIINFTPSIFIKPVSFINIYANHSYSCFVPINGIKEHVKSLFIQGAAILAVDNSIKLFFNQDEVIPQLAGFVLKTFIITEIMKTINKNKSTRIYEYKNFRYSISIRI